MLTRCSKLFSTKTPIHSKVLIIGSGDAGTSTAKMLATHSSINMSNVRMIDPSKRYWYQSFQTCVGAGILPAWLINFSKSWILPSRTVQVNAAVQEVDPENKLVRCDDGNTYSYEALVVASGLQVRPDLVKGLPEALEDERCPVGTNYIPKYAVKYCELRNNFQGGRAIFTAPSAFIKCGGAPQKIMYLSSESWTKRKVGHTNEFISGGAKFFPNDFFEAALLKVAQGYGVTPTLNCDLVEIKPKEQIAVFKNLTSGELTEKKFDIMHATPPQRAAPFIAQSNLASANGYVDVDRNTLQHKRYPSIFALGDNADLPTSKTASTLNEQSFVVAKNLISYFDNKPISEQYNGYTACPVFVGGRKLMLCEFGYDGKVLPTFLNDQRVPRFSFYVLKLIGFPTSYLICGPNTIRNSRYFFIGLKEKFNRLFSSHKGIKPSDGTGSAGDNSGKV
jgi:NADPH-dependent 2,4-dienoyl-CoA reductase/sulfur reductase-like enzyme